MEKDSLIPLKTKKKKRKKNRDRGERWKNREVERAGVQSKAKGNETCPPGSGSRGRGSPGENPRERRSQTGRW